MTSASATIPRPVNRTGRRCSLCGHGEGLCPAPLLPDFLWRPTLADRHTAPAAGRVSQRNATASLSAACHDDHACGAPGPESLLCCGCQRRLGAWDRYAQEALACASVSRTRADARSLTVDGLDYARFKLFQLSVLWRAGISRAPLFRGVKLGPHEGKLRRMLLGNDPGPAHAYPVMLFVRRADPSQLATMTGLVAPVSTTIGGRRSYRFGFGLLDWVFTVSSEPLPDHVQSEALQLSGRMALGLPATQRAATPGAQARSRVRRRAQASGQAQRVIA